MVLALSLSVIVLLVAVDQLVKVVVQLTLQHEAAYVFIPRVLQFHYLENRGAAFGILENARWLFIILTIVILTVGIYMLVKGKLQTKFLQVAAILLIGGGLGNMIDRIFRQYVIDYIQFIFVDFAVFNFADILVVTGVIMLLVHLIFFMKEDELKLKRDAG